MKTIIALAVLTAACHAVLADPICTSISSQLSRMREIDQAVREMIKPEEMVTTGYGTKELPLSLRRMIIIDKQHDHALTAIIRKCGWPRKSVHGETITGAAWLLAQHASLKSQKEMLPKLAQAVADEEAAGSDLAYLTDRIRIHDGHRQLYGTQLDIKPPCLVSVLPLADATGVNERRSRMKMPPLEVYLEQVHKHLAEKGCLQQ